jgi:hypothetical protein
MDILPDVKYQVGVGKSLTKVESKAPMVNNHKCAMFTTVVPMIRADALMDQQTLAETRADGQKRTST